MMKACTSGSRGSLMGSCWHSLQLRRRVMLLHLLLLLLLPWLPLLRLLLLLRRLLPVLIAVALKLPHPLGLLAAGRARARNGRAGRGSACAWHRLHPSSVTVRMAALASHAPRRASAPGALHHHSPILLPDPRLAARESARAKPQAGLHAAAGIEGSPGSLRKRQPAVASMRARLFIATQRPARSGRRPPPGCGVLLKPQLDDTRPPQPACRRAVASMPALAAVRQPARGSTAKSPPGGCSARMHPMQPALACPGS